MEFILFFIGVTPILLAIAGLEVHRENQAEEALNRGLRKMIRQATDKEAYDVYIREVYDIID